MQNEDFRPLDLEGPNEVPEYDNDTADSDHSTRQSFRIDTARRVVGAVIYAERLLAFCSDGSVWFWDDDAWFQTKSVPGCGEEQE